MTNSTHKSTHLNQSLGRLIDFEQAAHGLEIVSTNGWLTLEVFSPSMIRVLVGRGAQGRREYGYAVCQAPQTTHFKVLETDEELTLTTEKVVLKIQKTPLRLSFYTTEGELISQDDSAFGVSWIGNEVSNYKSLQEGERFVGLGEKTGNLDRKGSAYVNWNTDYFGYPVDADPLYLSVPFYMGFHHGLAYGIFLDNNFKTTFNFGASNDRFSYFSADNGLLDYYFIHDDNPKEILREYTWLTGRASLPAKWSLGLQQCRYSYYPDSEFITLAKTFRDKKIPADVLYLDIHYMDAYKVFSFDEERFPKPPKMIQQLEDMGFKVVVIMDPGIKTEAGYAQYESGIKEDVFVKYPDGVPFSAEVWPGRSHFPDFTSSDTRKWWGDQMDYYTDMGLKGFWNDMNEPACWGQHIPDLIEFELEGQKGTHKEARNVYGMQMARATAEGAAEHLKNERSFVLTRAGFAGIQRYAAVWTGDNVSTEEHMMAGVRLINSLGMSGIAICGNDIGGFAGEPTPSLYARWMSVGAFSPFFRGHSMINTRDAEPWSFGEEVEEIVRNYVNLRYRLTPYLYSACAEHVRTGLPVARSLALDFPHNPKIYEPAYQNQFMFGESMMVAPVESTQSFLKVYFPEGEWYDFYNDQKITGHSETICECPLNRLPVFVKASSILYMQQVTQSLSTPPPPQLILHIYLGNSTTESVYYEDDGTTYDYQSGKYYQRTLTLNAKSLHFSEVEGDFQSVFTEFKIYFHGATSKMTEMRVGGKSQLCSFENLIQIPPVSTFDPLGASNSAEEIDELPVLTLKNDSKEFLLEWE